MSQSHSSERGDANGRCRIELTNIVKTFLRQSGEEVRAIDDISLSVAAGEMLVVLGPSGCGKTTLLRCIAGLETPDEGRIVSEGRVVNDDGMDSVPPNKRAMSMLFQSYALWPHLTVFENVAYPLRTAKVAKSEIIERTTRILDRVGCGELADQYPGDISGGQQQRVALARALVPGNGVVLFDEPLSNVDAKVAERLRNELILLQKEIGFTGVYVTHNQAEALALADRVVVLEQGKIAQLASPREIYLEPVSRYVANFVGVLNEVTGTPIPNRREVFASQIGEVTAGRVVKGVSPEPNQYVVTCRPEHVQVSREQPDGPNAWKGAVSAVSFAGAYLEYFVNVGDIRMRVVGHGDDEPFAEDDEVWLSVPPGRMVAYADAGSESKVTPDEDGAGS